MKIDISKVKTDLLNTEYDFLRENKYLGDNIALLAMGGSIAYGTNLPTSDVDIRGFAINPSKQIFGLEKDFEQIVDINTDTTIYSLNKMVKLLTSCNPNTIEILGCAPEHYLYVSDAGRLVLDNKQNFLSIKAIDTFGGYANAQYNRLEHALLGNGKNNEKKLEMLLHSLNCALVSFNAKHKSTKSKVDLKMLSDNEYIDVLKERLERNKKELEATLSADLVSVNLDTKLTAQEKISKTQSLCDLYRNDLQYLEDKYLEDIDHMYDAVGDRIVLTGNFEDYPLDDIQALLREFHTIKSQYGNINKRNTKKDAIHLAKHMMHLVRLFKMGTKLNQSMTIQTHWDGAELEELMRIRNGYFMEDDGMRVKPEFYDLYHQVQNEYNYSVENTVLPEKPNIEALNEMLLQIYKTRYSLK